MENLHATLEMLNKQMESENLVCEAARYCSMRPVFQGEWRYEFIYVTTVSYIKVPLERLIFRPSASWQACINSEGVHSSN